jgi:signal transduction histidine kinase
MATKTGLRTEIVISTVLLLGAALLFAGFLLVKLTERELLEERRLALQRAVRLVVAADPSPVSLPILLQPLSRDGGLVAWRLLASDLSPLATFAAGTATWPDELPLAAVESGAIGEELAYSSAWNPLAASPPAYLDLAVRTRADPWQVLQLRFSLASLVEQVHRAQRLMLIYVVLYGAVLSLFGIYVLNRNVVGPIRRLRGATAGVASGDLTPLEIPGGPGEISDLAEDFNGMIAALQASRAETAAHIASLQAANRALQQARNEVIQAEKLASIGQLAAGMAHEIGNPLAAVIGYLNLLRGELVDPAQHDLVVRSLQETGRIDRLVRELLDYAAPTAATGEPFDPLGACRDAIELLANQGGLDGVELVDLAPASLGLVQMERSRFVQVCINLLLNARAAMPAGGEITLAAERQGTALILTLADNGHGIAPEVLPHIFEPFFTTKAPGKGRGLGLAVCQRLVSEAGGTIEVQSSPGQGCSFTLRLPAVREEG